MIIACNCINISLNLPTLSSDKAMAFAIDDSHLTTSPYHLKSDCLQFFQKVKKNLNWMHYIGKFFHGPVNASGCIPPAKVVVLSGVPGYIESFSFF